MSSSPISSHLSDAAEAVSGPTRSFGGHPLDTLTRGAFSAQTSGERMACIRDWLSSDPSSEQMQQVFKELVSKDKGAAKLLRERLDEIKRSKVQAGIALEWAAKAQALLDLPKLNLADALAWQRDAAKAGAPLSKDPLAGLKAQLLERVRAIEDLQHRVQVQREAAVLVAQRIEVLSTKPWREALAQRDALGQDVALWQAEAVALTGDGNWSSVDSKFPTQLQASQAQLGLVWEAFQDALSLAVGAAQDESAALPKVPVWADELRLARGGAIESSGKPEQPRIDPEIKAKAIAKVREVLSVLEQEVAQGHGKASAGAANALRNALREHGRLIDDRLEALANSALAAAGELEGWQRWRADQLRNELVSKAEALLITAPGQTPIGGRKMQETLRGLREQWKQTDQGGGPNHGLWKRFDDACNEAHKVVELWLDKLKAETAEHRARRLALIAEVKDWAQSNRTALDDDWKGFNRVLHQFGDRWRESGHVGEKLYAELQPQWKATIDEAAEPLVTMQKQSLAARHAMIDEARLLGAEEVLRIDAIKALQQRWQAEAHRIPIERKQEQKLWDVFRKPIDEAFARKTQERERAQAALSERDRTVLEASKSLQAANASGDAQAIRSAMAALEAALHGQAQAQAAIAEVSPLSKPESTPAQSEKAPLAPDSEADPVPSEAPEEVKPAPVRKPVVAMRGDDRPGLRRDTPVPSARGARPEQRKASPRDVQTRTDTRSEQRSDRFGRVATALRAETPRLGDTAFRAQREALEQAQMTLRKLSGQAHGEALVQLLQAWASRDAALMPGVQELGPRVTPGTRAAWGKALTQTLATTTGKAGDMLTALLRLEMASELPTPADYLSDRRLLQLQILTRRNDPAPAQTWGQDVTTVLANAHEAGAARRLQNVLKTLLKP